jgi:hypothetical protein
VEIGRGLSRCATAEAAAMAGKSRNELDDAEADAVLVHRDDLVVWHD